MTFNRQPKVIFSFKVNPFHLHQPTLNHFELETVEGGCGGWHTLLEGRAQSDSYKCFYSWGGGGETTTTKPSFSEILQICLHLRPESILSWQHLVQPGHYISCSLVGVCLFSLGEEKESGRVAPDSTSPTPLMRFWGAMFTGWKESVVLHGTGFVLLAWGCVGYTACFSFALLFSFPACPARR